jgi:hypothetical protein
MQLLQAIFVGLPSQVGGGSVHRKFLPYRISPLFAIEANLYEIAICKLRLTVFVSKANLVTDLDRLLLTMWTN